MIATLLIALLVQAPPVQPEPLPEPLPQQGPQMGPGGADRDQARQEMIRLFGEVETRLREIDALLYDASAGGASLEGADRTAISELLDSTESRSGEVVERMDRILDIAQQMGGGQGSGSSQGQEQPQSQGQSPLDQSNQGQSQGQREATPQVGEQPGQQPSDDPRNRDAQQQDPDPQRDGQDPNSDGRQPDSPRESDARPENRDADGLPPGGETGRVQVTDTAERWGDLPVHVRDLFRSEGGREMPTEYRDWIDSYYRRLNRRP